MYWRSFICSLLGIPKWRVQWYVCPVQGWLQECKHWCSPQLAHRQLVSPVPAGSGRQTEPSMVTHIGISESEDLGNARQIRTCNDKFPPKQRAHTHTHTHNTGNEPEAIDFYCLLLLILHFGGVSRFKLMYDGCSVAVCSQIYLPDFVQTAWCSTSTHLTHVFFCFFFWFRPSRRCCSYSLFYFLGYCSH